MNQAYTQIDPATGQEINGNPQDVDEYGADLPDYIDITDDVSLMFKGELITLSAGDRVYKAAHKEYEYHLLTYKGLCDQETILAKKREQDENPDANLNDGNIVGNNPDIIAQLQDMILQQSNQINAMQEQINAMQANSVNDNSTKAKKRGRPPSVKSTSPARKKPGRPAKPKS